MTRRKGREIETQRARRATTLSMGGANNAPNVSPSESDESFVSAELESVAPPLPTSSSSPSTSRRDHKPLTNTTSTSPTRNGRINGREHKTTTPLSSRIPPPPTLTPTGSYFTLQPGSHEPRSPVLRRPRPPASRSSHGIETLSGPPPALSTQRSYNNADAPWRNQPVAEPTASPKPLAKRVGTDDSIDAILQQASTSNKHDRRYSEPTRVNDGPHPLAATEKYNAAGMTYQNNGHMYAEDQDRTVRMSAQQFAMSRYTETANGDQSSQASPEDLFLDLVRADSVADDTSETMSRTERRRSRLGAQSRISRAPSSSVRPSTSGAQFPSYTTITPQNHASRSPALEKAAPIDSLTALRSDLTRHRPYASSAHPLEELSRTPQRLVTEKASFSSPMQHYSPESQRAIGRRRSIQATSTGLALNSTERSHLPRRTRYTSPTYVEPSKRDEGTESTVSTRAASTVWDELDDMKSRIRQLELTGKLPPSSNAAISNALGDRPPTAGTTMTTLSSSPKRLQRQSASPEHVTRRQPGTVELHPLLHSALKRAKDTVNPDIYRYLETTAEDALTMTAIVGDEYAQETAIERQLRRKADGMCRSLTELCIALAEDKSDAPSPGIRLHPGSKDGTPVTHNDEAPRDSRFLRGVSEDPELRASSRVMSRLESRRTSLLLSGASQSPRDVSQEPATTPTQPATTFVSKLDRTSSVLRRREKDEESKVLRAPSRATTEVGQMRPSPQSRMSREYVSNHPLPKLPQRSPSVQPSLSTPKSYLSSAANSPITPKNILPGTKRYLQGSNPPSSTDSTRVAEARQRRLASLGQSNTASQPLVGRIRLE